MLCVDSIQVSDENNIIILFPTPFELSLSLHTNIVCPKELSEGVFCMYNLCTQQVVRQK